MAHAPEIFGNSFLDTLESADADLITPNIFQAEYAQQTVLAEPGFDTQFAYFPVGMVMSVVTMMEDGQGVEVSTVGHESGYGLLHALGSSRSMDRVIVQIPGPGYRIAISRLKAAAAASVSLTNLMIRHVQADLVQTQQSVACNALHHVEARLCRWLLISQDRTRTGKVPLTQEYLSFMLGVQRTTVTGAARALQSAGLIRYVRGQIEVLDRAGLEEGACECYAAVREKQAHLLGHDPMRVLV
jgi:CRP-like cAMP-binding protein